MRKAQASSDPDEEGSDQVIDQILVTSYVLAQRNARSGPSTAEFVERTVQDGRNADLARPHKDPPPLPSHVLERDWDLSWKARRQQLAVCQRRAWVGKVCERRQTREALQKPECTRQSTLPSVLFSVFKPSPLV